MNGTRYFDSANYTGNHLHIDNFTDEFNALIEAIALERQDKTMDVFFNGFKDEREFNALFCDKEHYYDDLMGVFLGNVNSDREANELFRNWVGNVLVPYRNRTM